MSLRKRCSRTLPEELKDGNDNPLYCSESPRCRHPWRYDFRVNRQRCRASTETADKHRARDIEARERAGILEGRHGIRRQPAITFRQFAPIYLRDHAELHKRSVQRDYRIITVLNQFFGSLAMHELTAHRIEQFKRDRLAGKWRAYRQKGPANRVQPATVNRELDTLKSILSKAVEWGKLRESPARGIRRLKVENQKTRILTEDEQRDLVGACSGKLRAIVILLLITAARISEVLTLRWDQCQGGVLSFLRTKSGKAKQIPISPLIEAVLASQLRMHPWVFTNSRTGKPYTTISKSLGRALARVGITTGDVTPHTLRHTALSRMIEQGYDDYTVMAISGHSSTRMLARYTHPTEQRKLAALETFAPIVVTSWAQSNDAETVQKNDAEKTASFQDFIGGRQGIRTPDLSVANAALSQLS